MKNRTELAILGLLADGPRSGYDIAKQVQETLSHFWNESVSHIYPMLGRLHGRGLVTRVTEPGEGRPARHVYAITEEGLAELRAWLADPIEPSPPRLEILLKIFFGAHTSPETLIGHVTHYRSLRQSALDTLENVAKVVEKDRRRRGVYFSLTVSSGIHAARAAIAWCDETLTRLQALQRARTSTTKRPAARKRRPPSR